MGFSSIVFELDAKTFVYAFHSLKSDDSKFDIAIQDCHFLCQQGFQLYLFCRETSKQGRL